MLVAELDYLVKSLINGVLFYINYLHGASSSHMSSLLTGFNLFRFLFPGFKDLTYIFGNFTIEFSIIKFHNGSCTDNFQDLVGEITAQSLNELHLSNFWIDVFLVLHVLKLFKYLS